MIAALISYADGHKTSVPLSKGLRTFGTGIECDVVLPKSEALTETFTIHCADDGAKVEVRQGVVLTVQSRSGKTTELVPAQPYQMSADDTLKLDGIEIALHGIAWSARTESLNQSSARPILRQSLFASAVPILCGAMYWTVWTGLDGKATSAPAIQLAPKGTEETATIQFPEMNTVSVLAMLIENGVEPENLTPLGNGYAATFFVADAEQRDALLATLNNLRVPITPRIILDSAILEAVSLSMSLANKEADEVSVHNGIVHISGAPSNAAWRKDLIEMLERDISSLKTVRFSGQSEKWKSDLDNMLVAVWAGRNPYLVLSDGGQVRPGQEVTAGVTLIRLQDEKTLLVSVNGNHQEYVMK